VTRLDSSRLYALEQVPDRLAAQESWDLIANEVKSLVELEMPHGGRRDGANEDNRDEVGPMVPLGSVG